MKLFRKKKRSDLTWESRELRDGLIVWVEGNDGREERVYFKQAVITMAEYRKQKAETAQRNREKYGALFHRGRRRHTVHPSYPGSFVPGGVA